MSVHPHSEFYSQFENDNKDNYNFQSSIAKSQSRSLSQTSLKTDVSQASQSYNSKSTKHLSKNETFDGMVVGSQITLTDKQYEKNNCCFATSNLNVHNKTSASQPNSNSNSNSNSKNGNRLLTNEVGTRWYKAPELLYGSKMYDYSIDLWAVGCIICEIITKTPLFNGETDIDQLCRIFNILGTIHVEQYPEIASLPDFNKILFNVIKPKNLGQYLSSQIKHFDNENFIDSSKNEYMIDLIECCFKFNPKLRITSQKAMKHSWFEMKNDIKSESQKDINTCLSKIVENATNTMQESIKNRKKQTYVSNHIQNGKNIQTEYDDCMTLFDEMLENDFVMKIHSND